MNTSDTARFLSMLASFSTNALTMGQRHARQQAERLAAALLETLLNAIDANDPDTGGHVRRVAAYSLELASAAGLDEPTMRSIERIALFHDIGKIHQALFDIVHDERKLTPVDRRAIRTHPGRGADVLAPITPFYPDLRDGVLAHHEWWNGKGYPNSLRGLKIPLAARVVAIADTYDAVHHSRRYRGARGVQRALDVIAEGRGTQFDPELVDLFLCPPLVDALREIEQTMKRRTVRRGRERRSGRTQKAVDVTFRWRDELPEPHEKKSKRKSPPRARR